MFTGIVEEMGIVEEISISEYGFIKIKAKKVLEALHIGDSIAVNGVCLTVTNFTKESFTADVMAETVHKSNLKSLQYKSYVNLERAMKADGRFGGHIVTGHIDAIGTIKEIKQDGNAKRIFIQTEKETLKYIVQKGSIAIDGISLTVVSVSDNFFEISVIPHTGEETTLLTKQKGAIVNLETDILAKYIEKLLCFQGNRESKSSLTLDYLQKCGF